MTVSTLKIGEIALVSFAHPPVNALSVRSGLVARIAAALDAALAEPDVEAVVVASEGRHFSAGADVRDLDGDPAALDAMRRLTEIAAGARKPVVAAMQGLALGGGLELALACQGRIATADACLGLPEITLGLLPGGGGSQRLPRLVGPAKALDMMLGGEPIGAAEALAIGLIDAVAVADLRAEAVTLARGLAAAPPRRPPEQSAPPAPPADAARRGKPARAVEAILACLEAAATLPLAEGLALEKAFFDDLLGSEASLGLRHVFFGRRQVGRIPGLPVETETRAIDSVAIVGGGAMGTGIAVALAAAGRSVAVVEPREAARVQAAETARQAVRRDLDKRRIDAAEAQAREARLSISADMAAIAGADLVIEAVFEDMAVKQEVFAEIARYARPDAILASNTSTLDIDAIGALTPRPEDFLGLHFFNPAQVMKLLEVVRGARTSAATLARAMRFARDIGKVGVVSGVCDGFIGNRMFEEYLRQAYFLLEDGALPLQVDAALERWGMAMGPFKVMDLAGQDIGWSIRKRRKVEQPDRPYSGIPDAICELGRFGRKTGAGYYLYADGRTAQPDPEIDRLIVDYSRAHGLERRAISDEEIVERCIFALINEGAKILDEAIAYRPVDIDMVYVFGYGFPAERGGPMFHGDRLGARHVLERIRAFARGRNGWSWTPADLLVKLAAEGGRVAALNAA